MKKVLCFGELLLRLSPQLNGEWLKENAMPVFLGGAELNTATALARWNQQVAYFSVLPEHYLSAEIKQHISSLGIEDRIVFSGNRIGTYYLPLGKDLKNAGVIYDRAHSSFWNLKPGMLPWNDILEGIEWLNLSAISPALNAQTAAVCLEAVKVASDKGIRISFDLNYRAKLWQYGRPPVEMLNPILEYCDLVMGNIWAASTMLGITLSPDLEDLKPAYLQESFLASQQIIERFPKVTKVANTFRFDRKEGIEYYASLFSEGNIFVSKEHSSPSVIDRVGSGDCFMAGLIYSSLKGFSDQDIIEYAAAAAFDKLFIAGDTTTSGVKEIQSRYLNYV